MKNQRGIINLMLMAPIWAFLLLCMSACGGGSGVGAGTEVAVTPPAPPPPLAGSASALAKDVIETQILDDPIREGETTIDVHGREIERTRIQIDFAETATVGEVNDLLIDLRATITASVEGLPSLVVRIPDSGSLSALDSLIAEVESRIFVDAALEAELKSPMVLPANLRTLIFNGRADPENASEWRFAGHHLAINAAAAWNAAAAIKVLPRMVFEDYFGQGTPAASTFDVLPMLGQEIGYRTVPLPSKCTNPTGADIDDCEEIRDRREHGYWTVGIAAGTHFGIPGVVANLHEQVTGMVPFTVDLRVVDHVGQSSLQSTASLLADLKLAALNTHGVIVVNHSLGYKCDAQAAAGEPCRQIDDIRKDVRSWIRSVRFLGLEDRVLFVSAASNRETEGATGYVDSFDAKTASDMNAANLIATWPDAFGMNSLPALTNTLTVENARRTPEYMKGTNSRTPSLGINQRFEGKCTNDSSFVGGDISGIGAGGVYSSIGGNRVDQEDDGGTSSAAPQVAGLAALMSGIDPNLTPQQIIEIITAVATPLPIGSPSEKCSNVNPADGTRAPLIDAYASVLALDPPATLIPSSAGVRRALLDVTGPEGQPDGHFGFFDLEKFVSEVSLFRDAGFGVQDYGLSLIHISEPTRPTT